MYGVSHGQFHAFSEYDGFTLLENQKKKLITEITRQQDDYILNVNSTEYIAHLVDRFKIPPIEIHTDKLSISTEERMIPAEMYPNSFYVRRGESYPKDVITFHLPFSGDAELLKIRASTYSMSAPLISIARGEINFEIVNFDLDGEQINKQSQSIVKQLTSQSSYLNNDLARFNASLNTIICQAFEERKKHLLKKNDLLASIGVPVRKSTQIPATFSVPAKTLQRLRLNQSQKYTKKDISRNPHSTRRFINRSLELSMM